jgi:hypothetical protein
MDTIDTKGEAIDAAAEACLKSDDLVTRAMDWVGTFGYDHAHLVEAIVDAFRASPQFDTWAMDVCDGADVA